MEREKVLDFERPIQELEEKIAGLKATAREEKVNLSAEIAHLEEQCKKTQKKVFSHLTAWQKVQLSRHPKRPYTLDYINSIFTKFTELHGDRGFADDQAMVGGLARLDGQATLVIGQQKGRNVQENVQRNFGMVHPEGYRKALRLMKMAAKFGLPVISFIDTPGAYPGIGAEERGQAEAIAFNLRMMSTLKVPIIVVVIGEGGSGGALGIGVGNRILMLENAIYSVISPEGCAAILWRDAKKAPRAAEALKLTAQDLLKLGIIDEIIPEPLGGAHRDYEFTIHRVKKAIRKHLKQLQKLSREELVSLRYKKYRKIGKYKETKK